MYNPLRDSDGNVIDALILRCYKAPTLPDQSDAWTVPDDRKVNPWDLNEPDPTDNGSWRRDAIIRDMRMRAK